MGYLGLLSISLLSLLGASGPRGVLVEGMQPGFAAQRAGLRAGDILLGWEPSGGWLVDGSGRTLRLDAVTTARTSSLLSV